MYLAPCTVDYIDYYFYHFYNAWPVKMGLVPFWQFYFVFCCHCHAAIVFILYKPSPSHTFHTRHAVQSAIADLLV